MQQGGFYQGEQQVQQIVTSIGRELTANCCGARARPTEPSGVTGKPGIAKRRQPGLIILPMEGCLPPPSLSDQRGRRDAMPPGGRLPFSFGAATPLLAELLSFKVSALTPEEVAQDFAKHGLSLSSASFDRRPIGSGGSR